MFSIYTKFLPAIVLSKFIRISAADLVPKFTADLDGEHKVLTIFFTKYSMEGTI